MINEGHEVPQIGGDSFCFWTRSRDGACFMELLALRGQFRGPECGGSVVVLFSAAQTHLLGRVPLCAC